MEVEGAWTVMGEGIQLPNCFSAPLSLHRGPFWAVSPPLPSETCCQVSSSQGCPARLGQVRRAPKRPCPRTGVGELALGEETGNVAKTVGRASESHHTNTGTAPGQRVATAPGTPPQGLAEAQDKALPLPGSLGPGDLTIPVTH